MKCMSPRGARALAKRRHPRLDDNTERASPDRLPRSCWSPLLVLNQAHSHLLSERAHLAPKRHEVAIRYLQSDPKIAINRDGTLPYLPPKYPAQRGNAPVPHFKSPRLTESAARLVVKAAKSENRRHLHQRAPPGPQHPA